MISHVAAQSKVCSGVFGGLAQELGTASEGHPVSMHL